jgi:hypothetical protein
MRSLLFRGLIAGLSAGIVYFVLMAVLGRVLAPYQGSVFASSPMAILQGLLLGLVYAVVREGFAARFFLLRGLAYGLVIWLLVGVVPFLGASTLALHPASNYLNVVLSTSLVPSLIMGIIVVEICERMAR